MNEIDLGRLLPVVVIWIIWMLMTRRRGKEREEVLEQPPAGVIRTEKDRGGREGFDARRSDQEPAELYYHPASPSFLRPAAREPAKRRQVPVLKQESCARKPDLAYRAGVSKKDLRRLMVWSEILAPPVGMRKKEQS
jgi:hypothetical protein